MTNTDKERADFASETDGDFLERIGLDAAKWAHEFRTIAKSLGYSEMDEGWLIGWFANAIERGRDAGREAERAEAVTDAEPIAYASQDLRKKLDKHGNWPVYAVADPDHTASDMPLYTHAPKSEPSPDVEAMRVKPLDLSTLLRHAFLSGRGLRENAQLSEADQAAWLTYDAEALPPYQRIVAALSKPEGK